MPFIRDTALDALLDDTALAVRVSICSTGEPATYAAIAGTELGEYTITAGDGNGDWTIADGDTSGRKLTLSAQTGTNATGTGTAVALAFHDNASILYATIACTSVAVTSGVEFQINAVDVFEVADAA
jgi:hypothetical protein